MLVRDFLENGGRWKIEKAIKAVAGTDERQHLLLLKS
jgi:hypothetical protein